VSGSSWVGPLRGEVGTKYGDSSRAVAYWVSRFKAEGEAGLNVRPRPGQPKKLTPAQITKLRAYVAGACQRGRDVTGSSLARLIKKILGYYHASSRAPNPRPPRHTLLLTLTVTFGAFPVGLRAAQTRIFPRRILRDQTVTVSFIKPWDSLAETNLSRGPITSSLSRVRNGGPSWTCSNFL